MRKLGFVLPLVIAAVAFGAEPEKKAPEAANPAEVKEPAKKAEAPAKTEAPKTAEKKTEAPAKAEAPKAAEKKAEAPAKKVEPPIGTPIPWFVPEKAEELESGMEFKVPAEGIRTKANMTAGEARSVLLKENAGGTWIVNAVNEKVATVKQIAKDGAWVTFEITAIHSGRTLLEMSQVDHRNAPLRAFRCYIEVK